MLSAAFPLVYGKFIYRLVKVSRTNVTWSVYTHSCYSLRSYLYVNHKFLYVCVINNIRLRIIGRFKQKTTILLVDLLLKLSCVMIGPYFINSTGMLSLPGALLFFFIFFFLAVLLTSICVKGLFSFLGYPANLTFLSILNRPRINISISCT